MTKFILPVLLAFPVLTFAEDLFVHQQKALQETQDLLRDKGAREKAIADDDRAQDADAKAGALAGSAENKEKMYDVSADVMKNVVEKTEGDENKMKAMMEDAQKNPEKFYNEVFDEKSKADVRALANDIQKNQAPTQYPK